jgi:hypothetical protein
MLHFVTFDNEIQDTPERTAFKSEEKIKPTLETDSESAIDNEQKQLRKTVTEDFDFGLVPVLTPLGHVSYVTKYTYEKGKETDGSKLNFWRPLKRQ